MTDYRGKFPYSQNPSVFKHVLFPNFKAWFWDRNERTTRLLILTLTLVHLALKYPDNSGLGSLLPSTKGGVLGSSFILTGFFQSLLASITQTLVGQGPCLQLQPH